VKIGEKLNCVPDEMPRFRVPWNSGGGSENVKFGTTQRIAGKNSHAMCPKIWINPISGPV
jgi:hypothetical protein